MSWLLLPRPDYQILDTWFASGMRGSGSKDIVIKDAFVPAHRTVDPDRCGAEEMTGWEVHGRLSYRAPLRCLAGWDLAVRSSHRPGRHRPSSPPAQRGSGPGRTADSVALQLRLAEAAAEVDAARALHRQDIREISTGPARGQGFSELDRIRYRRDKAFIARLCVRAVDACSKPAGRAPCSTPSRSSAVIAMPTAPRIMRAQLDLIAEQFGRQALGLGPNP